MKRQLAAFAALSAAVVAAAVGVVVVPAALGQSTLTVTVDQVGWWTDQPVSAPAGEGGFEVAAGVEGGVQSVAAFQVTIPAEQVDRFALTFVEAAGFGSEFAAVAICRTEERWIPADPGPLAEAPVADCSTKVYLSRVLEERTWIGDVAPVVAGGGTVSLVVLPEYHAPSPLAAGTGMRSRILEIEIEAEGSAAPSSTTTTTLDFSTPGGANQYEPFPDSGITGGPDPVVDVESPGSVDFAAPDDGGGAVTPEPGDEDASGDEDDGFFALDPEEAVAGDSTPWLRLVFLVPLAIAFGVGSSRFRRLLREGGGDLLARTRAP